VYSTSPTIEIGGRASPGGGDPSTNQLDTIGQSLAQPIANVGAPVLAPIRSPYSLSVTGVAAANAAAVAAQPNVVQVSVSDTAADVQANLGSLVTLAAAGKLASITLTNPRTPTLTLTTSQITADAAALALIASAYNLSVTGVAAANAVGVAAQPHVTQVLVSDTAADVLAALGSLETLAAAGKLASITLTQLPQFDRKIIALSAH
jgi:hypothetical protein